jgi:hypothetical protein
MPEGSAQSGSGRTKLLPNDTQENLSRARHGQYDAEILVAYGAVVSWRWSVR